MPNRRLRHSSRSESAALLQGLLQLVEVLRTGANGHGSRANSQLLDLLDLSSTRSSTNDDFSDSDVSEFEDSGNDVDDECAKMDVDHTTRSLGANGGNDGERIRGCDTIVHESIRPHAVVEKRYRMSVNRKLQELRDAVEGARSEVQHRRTMNQARISKSRTNKSAVLTDAARCIDNLVKTYKQYEVECEMIRGRAKRWIEAEDSRQCQAYPVARQSNAGQSM